MTTKTGTSSRFPYLSRRAFTGGAIAASVAGPAALGAVSGVAAQNVTEVTFWQFNTEEFIVQSWTDAIAAFEADNPDVKVKMEIVPWADQHQKLVTGLATGSLPDVSMLGNNVVAEFQALGALSPMTSYFEAWSAEAGSDVTEDIWPGDKLYYFLQDEWWASPVAEETRCVYYRKDLFETAGLGTEGPKTFDELRDFALKLTSGDVYGFGFPGGLNYGTLQTFMSVYLGYGARFLNEDGTCGFDSAEFRDALTFYTNLYLVDKVSPPDTPVYDNETLTQLFIDGKLGMTVQSPTFWNQIAEASPDLQANVGIAPIPAGPAGQFGFLGGWPLVLWKASKNPDAAFRWIRYATDPKGALPALSTASGNIPGKRSIADQEPWNAAPLNVFTEQMEYAYPYQYPEPEIPQMGTLEVDAIQTAVQAVLLEQSDVDTATLDLVQHINDVLSR
jgi:ABC-type glycerol-3-phosphate transport system substrate-binding protein